MPNDQQQVEHQLWSIERVIAFVVAPIATPASGFIAAWLAKHGIHVRGDAIYAYASSVSLGTAASFITWLLGRQKFLAHTTALEGRLGEIAGPVGELIPASDREALLKEVEGIVAGHTAKLAAKISGQKSSNMGSPAAAPTPEEAPSADPWEAPNDPAPDTPPETETPPPLAAAPPGNTQAATTAPGTAADAGAVIRGS